MDCSIQPLCAVPDGTTRTLLTLENSRQVKSFRARRTLFSFFFYIDFPNCDMLGSGADAGSSPSQLRIFQLKIKCCAQTIKSGGIIQEDCRHRLARIRYTSCCGVRRIYTEMTTKKNYSMTNISYHDIMKITVARTRKEDQIPECTASRLLVKTFSSYITMKTRSGHAGVVHRVSCTPCWPLQREKNEYKRSIL